MKHRDELEAAHQRIKQLEGKVSELEAAKNEPEPRTAPRNEPKKAGSPRMGAGCAFGGISGFVVFILAMIVGGTHACVACNSDVTDPALEALRKCPAATELLGDNIEWSLVGCANYRGRSGGDPINSGCHSSQSFEVPVSGTKGRGSYRFSASQPAGAANRFTGGTLSTPGRYISISSNGTCTSHAL